MFLKSTPKALLLPLLISLFGMALIFLATPHGIGLSPDSISYIRGSRILLETGSLQALPPHWPPGYPILLALFALPQGDHLIAARFIGVLVFGLNLFLFSALLRKSGWGSLLVAFFTSLLLFDPDFINIHLMAWSEPVFLTLVQIGLLALLFYSESKSKKALLAFGLAFGLAALVRYAGVAFICGVASILFFQSILKKSDDKFHKRLIPLLQFLSMAVLPIALWVLGRSSGTQQGGIRPMVFHAIPRDKWLSAQSTIANWFGGIEAEFVLFVILVIFLLSGYRYMSSAARRILIYSSGLLVIYITFLLVSLLYFDAYIPLDNRILAPAKLLLYLAIIVSLHAVAPKWKILIAGVFSVFVLTNNYVDSRSVMSNSSKNGIGFSQVEMKNQPILSFIKENGIEVDATNSPELLLLYLNKDVPMLPSIFDPISNLPIENTKNTLGKLAQARNTVVIFKVLLWRKYLPSPEQLMAAGFTNVVYEGSDGLILQHP